MKIDQLSAAAQDGLRLWANEVFHDELALDAAATEHWAWAHFLLKVSPDRPEWFPKGKWATLQIIEGELLKDALEDMAHK
jgi:hypothetical protein